MNKWPELIKLCANGRTICNCGEAYTDVDRDGNSVCMYGCGAAQIEAKEIVAARVLNAVKGIRGLGIKEDQ